MRRDDCGPLRCGGRVRNRRARGQHLRGAAHRRVQRRPAPPHHLRGTLPPRLPHRYAVRKRRPRGHGRVLRLPRTGPGRCVHRCGAGAGQLGGLAGRGHACRHAARGCPGRRLRRGRPRSPRQGDVPAGRVHLSRPRHRAAYRRDRRALARNHPRWGDRRVRRSARGRRPRRRRQPDLVGDLVGSADGHRRLSAGRRGRASRAVGSPFGPGMPASRWKRCRIDARAADASGTSARPPGSFPWRGGRR